MTKFGLFVPFLPAAMLAAGLFHLVFRAYNPLPR